MGTSTCETCGGPITKRHYGRPGRFCSQACYFASDRTLKKTVERRVRMVRDHPLAPPSGKLSVARATLYDKIGPGAHPCHWCGVQLQWVVGEGIRAKDAIVVDHLDWDTTNDAPENLVPSCNHCNAHRTRSSDRRRLEQDALTVTWGGAETRAAQRTCEQCGTSFLTIPAAVKRGRGRFCSRSCARRAPRKPRSA